MRRDCGLDIAFVDVTPPLQGFAEMRLHRNPGAISGLWDDEVLGLMTSSGRKRRVEPRVPAGDNGGGVVLAPESTENRRISHACTHE